MKLPLNYPGRSSGSCLCCSKRSVSLARYAGVLVVEEERTVH